MFLSLNRLVSAIDLQATWDYDFYYKPAPLPQVAAIFKSCKGRDVSKLRDFVDKVDKLAFADVVLPGRQ